jgi:hypothetical protein
MYRRADDVVDTSGETPEQSFATLCAIVAAAQRGTREWRT